MGLVIYGDFNCPYSYLASQRADRLAACGVAVEWRAVEHDPRLPVTGRSGEAVRVTYRRELAEVAGLAGPEETLPSEPPAVASNTRAAVAAYAEAVADGCQEELRRRLFHAIWVERRDLSSAYEVRRIVATLTYPPAPVTRHLSAELPMPVDRVPGPLARRFGATIAPDGTPLTTAAHRRLRRWREEWLARAGGVVPAVVRPPGAQGEPVLAGVAALLLLAELTAGEPSSRAPSPLTAPATRGEATSPARS